MQNAYAARGRPNLNQIKNRALP